MYCFLPRITALVLVCILFCSCSSYAAHDAAPNDTGHIVDEEITLPGIVTQEPPPGLPLPKTPAEVAERQFVFNLSDGSSVSPTRRDILWWVSVGPYGIVAIDVPKVTRPRHEIAMLKREGEKWVINGYFDVSPTIHDPEPRLSQLALPRAYSEYIFAPSEFKAGGYKAWLLAGFRPLIIARYPWIEVDFGSATRVKVHGSSAYLVGSNDTGWFVAYRDEDWLVVCGGSLTAVEAVRLAESLGRAGDDQFPFVSPGAITVPASG